MIHKIKECYFKYVEEPCIEAIHWGDNDNPIGLLTLGGIYHGRIEVHDSYSAIFLDIYPDKKFNSISFIEVENIEDVE